MNKKYLFIVLIFPCIAILNTLDLHTEVSNDAAQAISAADLMRRGAGYSTSILYFDEHYRTGKIPAPQTVWPPGYPGVIAIISTTGLPATTSATLISKISYVLLFVLLFLLARRLTESDIFGLFICFCMAGISEFWIYAATPNSEMPFTLISLAVFNLLALNREYAWKWAAASLLAGMAFTIRYAGVFLVGCVFVFGVFELIKTNFKNRSTWIKGLIILSPGCIVFLLLILRNYTTSGGIKGGNNKIVVKSLLSIVKITATAYMDLIGGININQFRSLSLSFGLAAISLIYLVFVIIYGTHLIYKNRRCSFMSHEKMRVYCYMIAYLVVYTVGMMWIATSTMITYGPRYILPVIPIALLVMACPYADQKRIRMTAIGTDDVATVGKRFCSSRYILTSSVLVVFFLHLNYFPEKWRRSNLNYNGSDWEAVNWIKRNTSNEDVVMAIGNGQRFGLYVQRPTVVIPNSALTSVEWNEERICDVVSRYKVKNMVVTKGEAGPGYSPFVNGLLEGKQTKLGIPIAETNGSRIYRVEYKAPANIDTGYIKR